MTTAYKNKPKIQIQNQIKRNVQMLKIEYFY